MIASIASAVTVDVAVAVVAAVKITLANQLSLNLRFRKFKSFIEKPHKQKKDVHALIYI